MVIAGKKYALSLNDVRPLKMPRFSELKLENLLEEVKNDTAIQSHLPELTGAKSKHNRQFVTTVIATIKPNFVWNLLETAHT